MSCQDDATFMGPVSLFIGIESANWSTQQFIDAANFCKQHKIATIILKVAEVGSPAGDIWYGGIAGVKSVVQTIKNAGVNVLTYQFLNGLPSEPGIAKQFLDTFATHCLDIEGDTWVGQSGVNVAQSLNNVLQSSPAKLYVSCPANPVSAGQEGAFKALSPSVNVWMPMVYSTYLDSKWETEIKQINAQACIQPTLDLSQEFGPNDPAAIARHFKSAGCLAMSCWEYAIAEQNSNVLDQVVQAFEGSQQVSVITNNSGAVLDVLKSNQLFENEMELCGPWSVRALALAGQPNKGPRGTIEDIDTWVDAQAQHMGYTPENFPGVSIQDMYDLMTASTDIQGGHRDLHWWDSPTDINVIRNAVKSGYPVLVTANEQNIIEKRTGQRPYPWNINANHVFPIVGIDKDGDFICADQLNNSFQGYWPVTYLANRLSPSWVSIVQVVGPDPNNPWLKGIPDPTKPWPANFNAQSFGSTPIPTPPPVTNSAMINQFKNIWDAGNTGIDFASDPVAQEFTHKYQQKYDFGQPVKRYPSNDWGNSPIEYTEFLRGHVETANGKSRWWFCGHEVTF